MADTPLQTRRFTDREVREILKRAVEESPSRALVKAEGLSLDELKAIGQEVGIDPARLEDAARAVVLGTSRSKGRIVGGPMVLDVERTVPVEISPRDTPDVLSVIRRTMGSQGEVAEIHGSLEWRTKGDAGERYVTLSPRDGTTTIRASANITNAAVLSYLPVGIVGLITTLVGLVEFVREGSTIGLVLFLTVLPALYAILRTIFRRYSGSESAKLHRVVHELARLAEGPSE
jgi:hypothetical protein